MKINEVRENKKKDKYIDCYGRIWKNELQVAFMEQHYPEKVIRIKSPRWKQEKEYKKVVQDKQLIDF